MEIPQPVQLKSLWTPIYANEQAAAPAPAAGASATASLVRPAHFVTSCLSVRAWCHVRRGLKTRAIYLISPLIRNQHPHCTLLSFVLSLGASKSKSKGITQHVMRILLPPAVLGLRQTISTHQAIKAVKADGKADVKADVEADVKADKPADAPKIESKRRQ